ncbi:hypothetical protein AN7519.2 [Aspergillus nidulans FGSC A4]|uniref:Transcription factor domain-containing protein n=1 Tax=Emericella nidulans (strain FGSC A4 / ATCC 38163 / CBS 112.46 / NRRL 194 / M139) TaxID=227321 RepID=Q5AW11_EMENI|nr:hypothetical protein [Aspergillus nidulans FGSC A4]EAA62099.1 hypothetical protein AN7519.2 [Aspergillus nidulans FGSC A4]CBF79551.1 TPA: conserved hypothetical protein [Aspergillus nidulans FGSC A4]|eukprot:XP_680788.1 hypothetical protein AN7519.2 [Aspergillus nidulans FGSC A4]
MSCIFCTHASVPVRMSDLSPDVYICHLNRVSHRPARPAPVPMRIPPSIRTRNPEEVSVSCFMRTYVLIVEKSRRGGHLAFLPEFYLEKSSESCLRLSVLSLGYLALFNNRHQSQTIWIQARKHYSAALAALAAVIDTKESAVRDEVFARPEWRVEDATGRSYPWGACPHSSQGSASLSGKHGCRLLAWAFNQLQIQAIANNEYGYAHLPSLFEDLERPDSVCQAIKLVSLVSGFCESTRETRHPPTYPQTLPQSLEEPPDQSANIWTACFMALITSSTLLFYVRCLDYFPAFFLTDCESRPADGELYFPVFYRYDIYRRIEQSLNTICSSVRYALGDLDVYGTFHLFPEINHGIAYNLRWPISLVSQCGFASTEQVLLCTEVLQHTYSATARLDSVRTLLRRAVAHVLAEYQFSEPTVLGQTCLSSLAGMEPATAPRVKGARGSVVTSQFEDILRAAPLLIILSPRVCSTLLPDLDPRVSRTIPGGRRIAEKGSGEDSIR